jgi:hypothetical protein
VVVVGASPRDDPYASSICVANLNTGKVLGRRRLPVFEPGRKSGVEPAVIVDDMGSTCRLLGYDLKRGARQTLVEVELPSLKTTSYGFDSVGGDLNLIRLGDAVAIASGSSVYRLNKQTQKLELVFSDDTLGRGPFQYIVGAGLFKLDREAGTVVHVADAGFQPLKRRDTVRLAGRSTRGHLLCAE